MQQSVWEAIAIVIATICGPIFAVQTQKHLEERREKRKRQANLFMALMATRSVRASLQHVEALNAIDLTFDGKTNKEQEVQRGWRAYHDSLNMPIDLSGEPVRKADLDTKFVDLLYAMSEATGRNFDKTYLKNSSYRPQTHSDIEAATLEMNRLLLEVLKGNRDFPIVVRDNKLQ